MEKESDDMSKNHLYKTALWYGNNEYVELIKYHSFGNFYEIRTISGEYRSVEACELANFCL